MRRIILVSLTFILALTSTSLHATVNDLWVAETRGALLLSSSSGDLELEITGLRRVRAVEVDLVTRSLWIFENRDLHRFDFTGRRIGSAGLDEVSSSAHAAIAVEPAGGLAWVGVGDQLRAVDDAGVVVVSSALPDSVVDVAADPGSGRVWVSTRSGLHCLDAASGVELWQTTLEGPVGSVALDLVSGEALIATGDEVRRYDGLGLLVASYPVPDARAVAVGDTGIWAATTKELLRLDAAGNVTFSTTPFDGKGEIGHLVVAGDRSAWVANHQEIAHYSGSGESIQHLSFEPPIHVWDLAVNQDFHSPALELFSPAEGACIPNPTFPFELTYSDVGWGVDPATVGLAIDGSHVAISCSPTPSSATCDLLDLQADGPHTLVASVRDYAENVTETPGRTVFVDTISPRIVVVSPGDGEVTSEPEITILGSVTEPAALTLEGEAVPVAADLTFSAGPVVLTEGDNVFELRAVDCAGNATTTRLTVRYEPVTDDLPPDPSTVASAIDLTVVTDIAASTEFLYSGPDPVQRDVTPGVIDPRRAAVIRGRVKDRSGSPVAGARIQILDHPELGWTLSRGDGLFDLVVNGGGSPVLEYRKDGFLRSQRRLDTPWRDFVWVDDVVMVPIDPTVTAIAGGSPEVQVARGTVVQDADGTRQATVVFPAGFSAEMVLPDGSRQPLDSLAFRATEYTVGPEGAASMPGELPATSGYTYAVELSVDEALAAGATSVELDRPAHHYVENFLDFPVGGIVPSGYYDREMAAWVPSENGRVVAILDVAGGIARVDVDGSGQAATPGALADLGFGEGELRRLAELYEPGQSLWRTPIPHFTPWDCNWPYGPPEDAEEPPDPDSDHPDPDEDDVEEQDDDDPEEDEDDSPCEQGSILDCENQTLGESVPVTGTPYALSYRSSRVPGRKVANTVEVRLSGRSVPASLKRVELTIDIAGRRLQETFPPLPHQSYTFTWDREDAYGRTLQGVHPALINVAYVYDGVYYAPGEFVRSFGRFSSRAEVIGDRTRDEVILRRSYQRDLGIWDATLTGLGGWTLSGHHAYDFNARTLHLGDGSQRRGTRRQALEPVSTPGLGSRESAVTMTQGPDGLYLTERRASGILSRAYVHRLGADGEIEPILTWSGTTFTGFAIDPAGRRYVSESILVSFFPPIWLSRVIEGGPGGRTVWSVTDLTFYRLLQARPDGSLVVFRPASDEYLRLWPDGRTAPTDTAAGLLAPDGSVYSIRDNRVWRLRPDGSVAVAAGTGERGFAGDGGPATAALLDTRTTSSGLALAADGSLLIADSSNGRVRIVLPGGTIHTLADLGPQVQTLGIDRFGAVYVSGLQGTGFTFRRIRKLFPSFAPGGFKLPDESGRLLYTFDAAGRHRTTFNALTGAVERSFEYDDSGLLTAIRDGDDEITTIERDASGTPTAIVGPFGQRTELAAGADGLLASVTLPGQREYAFEYDDGGLLRAFTNPRGMTSTFDYAPLGRLTRATDPAGGWKELRRFVANGRFRVELRTRAGRTTSYSLRRQAGPGVSRTTKTAGAPGIDRERLSDGSRTVDHPTGMGARLTRTPDPRFGFEAPTSDATITMPSGLTYSSSLTREVELSDAGDPLSLVRQEDTLTINGRVGSRLFEAAQRKVTLTSPEGRQATALADEHLRLLVIQPPATAPIEVTYDERGQSTRISQGEGAKLRSLLYSYRDDGYLDTLIDSVGRTVSFEYDIAGRVIEQQLPGDRTVGLGYDAKGNLTTVVPPGRPAHRFEYDAVDRVSHYRPPDPGIGAVDTMFVYDLDGRLTRIERPDKGAVRLEYDAAGRIASVRSAGGDIAYRYDTKTGHPTNIAGPGSVDLSYEYDGHLLATTMWSGEVAGSVNRLYNTDFRVAVRCVNGAHCVSFVRDDDGLLTRAGDLTLNREPVSGRLASTSLGVITTVQTYNTFGELETYSASVSGTPIFEYTLSRDLAGRIVGKTESVQGSTTSWTYSYSPAGQLDRVEKDDALFAQYSYDANGNRLSYQGAFGLAQGTYDVQDRLTSYGGSIFSYTANGDLQSRTEGNQNVSYDYDVYGNLRSVELPGGLSIEYLVDGEHRRVGKRVEGTLVKAWLYKDQLNPVAELDGRGNLVARFIYGSMPHVPDVIVKGGRTYRVLTDHLGSVRMIVNAVTGEVVQRMDYEEFGRVLLDTNPGFQPFGFAGGIYEQQTKLVRFGARDYLALAGRWTKKDRARFGGKEFNLYGYVGGDPINLIDVSGFAGCTVDFLGYPVTIPGTKRKVPINHAGVIAYDDEGNTRYYEYGRYPPGDHGRVRRQTVPDIKIGPDGKPTEESWEALEDALKEGPGKGQDPLIVCSEEADYSKIVKFAEKRRRNPENFPAYSWNPLRPNTCATFAREAVEAGLP